jgi:hypothetical protein
MNYIEKRELFLSKFNSDALELRFYQAAFKILESLSPAISIADGLGCIRLLYRYDITLTDGYKLGYDPALMGSIEDCAHVVAVMFAAISDDPIWWKATYAADGHEPPVSTRAKGFVQQLKQVDFVTSVR